MHQPIELVLDTQKMNGIVKTVNQFDNAILSATIRANGDKLQDWVNPTFELIAIKSDDNRVHQKDNIAVISAEDQQIDITLNEQIVTYAGRVKLQLIIKDEGRISTTTFSLMVNKSLEGQIIESINNVETLDKLDDYIKRGFELLTEFENRMASTENAMTELDATLTLNENARKHSETARVNNESQREENERTRATNESNRVKVESSRENAEIQRNENEEARQNAETQRGRNEDDRITNEDNRKQAELGREQAYALAEANRNKSYQTQEELRQSNYATNEAIRERNETTRKNAESSRVNAETQRGKNETTRQTNETNRVAAEEQREVTMTDLVARADKVISDVEGATEEITGARVDYMGNAHESINEAMDANVVHAVHQATNSLNHAKYEGQTITATNTIAENITALNEAGFERCAVLSGNTLVNLVKRDVYKDNPEARRIEMDNKNSSFYVTGQYTIVNLSNKPLIHNEYEKPRTWIRAISIPASSVVLIELTENRYLEQIVGPYNSGWNESLLEEFSKSTLILRGDHSSIDDSSLVYFDGMKSVKSHVLTTIGKNLFNIDDDDLSKAPTMSFEKLSEKTFAVSNGNVNTWQSIYSTPMLFKANVEYTISYDIIESTINYGSRRGLLSVRRFDNGEMVRDVWDNISPYTFTLTENTVCRLHFYCTATTAELGRVVYGNVQIEQGAIKTTYEPFKSNILSTVEPVELHGVGEVKDTLDCVSGEVINKMRNKEYLDERITLESSQYGINTILAYYRISDARASQGGNFRTNLFTYTGANTWDPSNDTESVMVNHNKDLLIRILKNRFNGEITTDSVKQWLLDNKFEVTYTLETPLIKTVKLSGDLVSYDGQTHYSCSAAEGSLIPTLEIDVPTDLPAAFSEQRNTIENQNKVINEQEEAQNVIINYQLSMYESISMAQIIPGDTVEFTVPQYIKDLYELAYERGIRVKEQHEVNNDSKEQKNIV